MKPSYRRTLTALGVTASLGIVSRLCPIGWHSYDKSLGDVLYAVAAYLVLALLLSRQRVCVVAAAALTFCLAVEIFKLTGLPAEYACLGLLVRWMLGTTFSWHNVACYGVGVGSAAALDAAWLRGASGGVSPLFRRTTRRPARAKTGG